MAHEDTAARMQAFVEEHGLGHIPHVVDTDGALWAHFQVIYQPNWVFVSADGAVEKVAGALSEEQLAARIDAMRR